MTKLGIAKQHIKHGMFYPLLGTGQCSTTSPPMSSAKRETGNDPDAMGMPMLNGRLYRLGADFALSKSPIARS